MDRECMNVVYASNDGYARHLGTSLYSLLDRNRDFAEIAVYVLTLGLSEENQGKLREIAEHFGRKLVFLNLDDLRERIGYEVDTVALISALCCACLWEICCRSPWSGSCIWTVTRWCCSH